MGNKGLVAAGLVVAAVLLWPKRAEAGPTPPTGKGFSIRFVNPWAPRCYADFSDLEVKIEDLAEGEVWHYTGDAPGATTLRVICLTENYACPTADPTCSGQEFNIILEDGGEYTLDLATGWIPPEPEPEPPTPEPAGFEYASAIQLTYLRRLDGVTAYRLEVDIRNTGAGPGTCHSVVYRRLVDPVDESLSSRSGQYYQDLTLDPGETGTISGEVKRQPRYGNRYEVEGDAGWVASQVI